MGSEPLTFDEIMMLPAEQRLEPLLARYMDLDEFTGCRTTLEQQEMERIAEATMCHLITERARTAAQLAAVQEVLATLAEFTSEVSGEQLNGSDNFGSAIDAVKTMKNQLAESNARVEKLEAERAKWKNIIALEANRLTLAAFVSSWKDVAISSESLAALLAEGGGNG